MPVIAAIIQIELLTLFNVPCRENAYPLETGDGACVGAVSSSKPYIGLSAGAHTVVYIPALKVVGVFGVQVQVVVYFYAVVPCPRLVRHFVDGFAAVPGYKRTFFYVLHQVETQAGIRYPGLSDP